MTPGQMFDSGLVILRARGLRIIGRCLLPAVVLYLTWTFIRTFVSPVLTEINPNLWMDVAVITVGLLIGVPVMLIAFSYIMYEAIAESAGFIMGEENIDLSPDWLSKINLITQIVFRMAPSLLVFTVLGSALVTGSSLIQQHSAADDFFMVMLYILAFTIFFAVPFTMTKVSMALSAGVVEKLNAKEAIRRGHELYISKARGVTNFGTAIPIWFLIWLFGGLLTVFVWGTMSMIKGIISDVAPGLPPVVYLVMDAIAFSPAIALQVVLLSVVLIVLYFERRVRFEAFDVYQMAEDMRNATRDKIRVR